MLGKRKKNGLDKSLSDLKEFNKQSHMKNEAMEREIEDLDYKIVRLRRMNRKGRK